MAEETVVPVEKKPYQSWTLWANLLMAAASFFPQVKEHMTPDLLGTVFAVVNMLLRFKTKSGLVLSK